MAAEKNNQIVGQSKYDLDAKWDACLDLTVRRFVYSSLAGTFGGLLFFSSFSLSLSLSLKSYFLYLLLNTNNLDWDYWLLLHFHVINLHYSFDVVS